MEGIWLIAFVLQWILLLLLAVLMGGVLRLLGSVQQRLQLVAPPTSRFELGERVSDFELPDLDGRLFTSNSVVGFNQKVLLLFLNITCISCKTVVERVAELANQGRRLKELGWSFILICHGGPAEVKDLVTPLASQDVVVVIDGEGIVYQQYGIRAFPAGIAIDSLGRVIDQSTNVGSSWLYRVLGAPVPAHPLV